MFTKFWYELLVILLGLYPTVVPGNRLQAKFTENIVLLHVPLHKLLGLNVFTFIVRGSDKI